MFHGNAGNIGHRIPIARMLDEALGCNVLMMEYRGYGLSTGTPDEVGLTIDAQTGLDYIRQRTELRDTKILVYGQSLGGAVAINLVAKNQKHGDIAGLILENTFTSIKKLIPRFVPLNIYLFTGPLALDKADHIHLVFSRLQSSLRGCAINTGQAKISYPKSQTSRSSSSADSKMRSSRTLPLFPPFHPNPLIRPLFLSRELEY